MMKAPVILAATAALALFLGSPAEARSTPSEMRGYNACLEAAGADLQGLVLERTYLIDTRNDQRTYYINGTAWTAGERVDVGLSCTTTRSGRLISASAPTFARYVPASDAGVQVASQ